MEYLKDEKSGATDAEREYNIVVHDRVAENAVTVFDAGPFQDFVKVVFSKVDAWFEEDERIYVHPKDPYKVFSNFKPIERILFFILTTGRGSISWKPRNIFVLK